MDDKLNSLKAIPQWLKPQNSVEPKESKRRLSLKGYVLLALTALVLVTHTMRFGIFGSWLGHHCERRWHFDFDHLDDFTLEEHLEPGTVFRRGLDGLVRVQKACPEQTVDLMVDVVLSRPSGSELDGIDIKITGDSMLIENAYPRPDLSSSTLDIVLHVKPGLQLDTFRTEVRHLAIELSAGLRISVTDLATLITRSGSIRSDMDESSFMAQRWDVQSTSGGIHGGWSQENNLAVTSSSGTIDLTIFPKERLSEKDPMTTDLTVRSSSGGVRVHYPVSGNIPARDFHADILTHSGRISGSFILGAYLKLKSSSGGISATVLPRDAAQKGQMITESGSGTTDVEVLPAHADPDATLRQHSGKHTTMSGGLRLRYPQSWEGSISGSTKSGGLTLSGRDVHVVSSGHGPVGHSVKASKGSGDGSIEFESMSGSARVQVGHA